MRWQGALERRLLADIPQSIEIIAGIADVKRAGQPVEELRLKIESLAAVVPPERLLASSSCGCGRCTPEQAQELMTNLVAAAHSV